MKNVQNNFKEGELTMQLKGSKTEKNVLGAFAGESQARNRYTYFASQAERKAIFRSPTSSKRQPTRRKNMRSGIFSSSKEVRPRFRPLSGRKHRRHG